jgi:cell surface protein SprA
VNNTNWLTVAARLCFFIALSAVVWLGVANSNYIYVGPDKFSRPLLAKALADTTGELIWPVEDNPNPSDDAGGINIPLPDNVNYKVEYNSETGEYEVIQTIGNDIDYRPRTSMSLDEYMNSQQTENVSDYWKEIQKEEDEANRDYSKIIKVGSEGFETIFGSNEIEIRPQGSAELTFGVNSSKTNNPRIPERQRRITTFNFDQKIQLNVVGNIGTRMKLNVNYNTESTFDFENQMKLQYTGDEDQIIQGIELGNVSLPLSGSLIQGSSSLFGAKFSTKWGHLRNTTVFSQQKGERKEITVQGGAQTQNFDITADSYEANRHYFLSGWFREQYDRALSSLPVVGSGVNITRIEVWLVNLQSNTQDVRNAVAFADLGEAPPFISGDLTDDGLGNTEQDTRLYNNGNVAPTQLGNPSNLNNDIYMETTGTDPNNLNSGFSQQVLSGSQSIQALSSNFTYDGYSQMVNGTHFERVNNMRKLTPSEFSYNTRLGFISLKQSLNNAEVLAVSYEYTLNGKTYQVGTISQDGFAAPQALVLKLIKPSITQVKLAGTYPAPLWQNMMKNVYSLGAFGIAPENFRLDVWYNNPATGVNQNYIPRQPLDGKILLQVLNLDKIDAQQMPYPDGFFDFIPNASTVGGLIDAQSGRIYFPVVEPFGAHLAKQIRDGLPGQEALANQIVSQVAFQPLYDSTKTAAQILFPNLNRYRIKGQYQSSAGSEISLNALNIPQGSVVVTAGGIKLTEGVDYTVDYNLGRVRILNDGIMSSGQPINVSVESNSLFNLQFKTMIGSRFDYTFNDNLAVGATFLNLRERPVTQKVNMGDEPVNNTVIGADANFQKESPFLTRLVDGIPFLETKAKSNITLSGEIAKLFPGHSKAISKDGNSYLDDFEGSQSVIDLRSLNQWFMASTPKQQSALFPEGNFEDSLIYNYNRARLSWYVIDPLFYRVTSGLTPQNIIDDNWYSDHRMREILEGEVFPNRQLPPGTPPNIATFDLTFDPRERGQYNYEVPGGTSASAGLTPEGKLVDPESRWGGVQRALTTTDFEASNVQFIQFWMMDPFNDDSQNNTGGELYFNLGNVSEDVLNDNNWTYENGFPSPNSALDVDTSSWGLYPSPNNFNVVNAFDNSTGNYQSQDIGLDGLNSTQEVTFFSNWLAQVQGALTDSAYTAFVNDPSADDFEYFRSNESDGSSLNTIQRYKYFNNNEGNSNTATPDGYPIAATTIPNSEDINQDITLNNIESYFQYKINLKQNELGEGNIGRNYITDSFETTRTVADGTDRTIRWYQFKIPIKEFDQRVGGIADFRSIRYIRMFLKGWQEPVTLRFARLELVRGEWRKFDGGLQAAGEIEMGDPPPTIFNIAAVNIEENGNRDPVPYVVPPGIIREQDVASANLRSLNEQSLSYQVCNLGDGDSRAAYRTVNFDLRQYKRLRMYAHAEALGVQNALADDDLTVFVRLGSDFKENYYEYEIPMKVTDWYNSDEEAIWPESNNFDILLKDLQNLKANRPANTPAAQETEGRVGNARIAVKGNPNLANVTVLMIGVRNPAKDKNVFKQNDDGQAKCAVIWVNELRLSEFDEKGGWAAVARMNATLADFATVAVAGNISTPGWGTLEQTVQERQQKTIMGFDANSTMQLGKFFPEKWGVTLPMYVGYSETVNTPRYSPLQPDLQMSDLPNVNRNLKKKSQDYIKRRSINFTNVRIAPKQDAGGGKEEDAKAPAPGAAPGAPPAGPAKEKKDHFYSIQNFSVTYAYNEEYKRDINIDWRLHKTYNGAFDYSFQNKPKEIRPFEKIPVISTSKYLKWIKEFNFYPSYKQIGFHTEMNRSYETSRIRNNTLELTGVYSDILLTTQVQKTWNWNRQYTFKYDLTKSIKFDFTASNTGLVGEPRGVIDKENTDWYNNYKDTVWSNIQNGGITTLYNHNASVSYKLPFDKFPLIDFISSDARYAATYRWDRAPFTQDSLGHTIQNSRNLQLNAQANLETLYNKVPLLKTINTGKKPKDDKKAKDKGKDDPTKKDGFGKDEKDKEEKREPINPLHVGLRFLMMVRNVSGTYSRTEGMLLPGYDRKTQAVGMDQNFDAPGFGFISGAQNTDIWGNPTGENFAVNAAENDWLVKLPTLNTQYSESFTETWNYKINLEPIKSFKVEITANKTEGRNLTSFFRLDDESDQFVFDSPMEVGNFSASVITWPTAFMKDDPNNGWNNKAFENFLVNRGLFSQKQNSETYNEGGPQNNGYYTGWGPTSQDVVIPAFIAAYTGRDPGKVSLNPFKTKVQPNWTVTYDGLSKIPSIKKYFKQFNIKHSYKSTFTTSYVSNLNFTSNDQGLPTSFDQSDFPNYIPQHQINNVAISEQIVPVSLDMTLKTKKSKNPEKTNEPQIKLEYKKDRTLGLGLTNYQVTETKSNAITIGLGYKINEVPNPFGRKKGSRLPIQVMKNTTINLRADLTVRDNVTIIRKMVEETSQPTAGQRLYSLKTSADMAVNDKLTIRFFYDHQLNRPKISTSFPTSNISTGISLRFSLNG